MKTIEERALEYANSGTTLFMDSPEEDIIYRDDIVNGYIAGAIDERKELLRWRDPKEEQPKDEKRVIVKAALRNGAILVTGGWYAINESPTGWSIDLERTFGKMKVIGWRPICD